jgi:dihydrofolate reductase
VNNQHRELRMVAHISLDGYISSGSRGEADSWVSAENKREFLNEVEDADILIGGRDALEQMPAVNKPVALLSRDRDEAVMSPIGGDIEWVVDLYPSDVHDFLSKRGGKRILVCGGSMAYDFMLRWNLIDNMVLIIEPITLGHGIRLRTPPQTQGGQDRCKFSLIKARPLNTRGTLRLDLRKARVW